MDLEAAKLELLMKLQGELHISPQIYRAFSEVPRERFVPQDALAHCYEDRALSLGHGATISQPSMLAILLQQAQIQPQQQVFEVGSGSGYFAALLSKMGANVTGVEIVPELAAASKLVLQEVAPAVQILAGDAAHIVHGRKFDRILFSAAVKQIPDWAVAALDTDGFVLAPVGEYEQELIKAWPGREERTGSLCRFVRLVES